MKFNRLWIGAVLLTLTTGCYTLRDDMDEFVFSTKNRLYAEQAWMASKSIYSDVECRRNFADGFCDGYVNVAAGGKGCVPKLPPRKYWKAGYQSPTGRQKVLAWFNGYSHGALAAEKDGVAGWSRITVAPNTCPTCIGDSGGHGISVERPLAPVPAEALPPPDVTAVPTDDKQGLLDFASEATPRSAAATAPAEVFEESAAP